MHVECIGRKCNYYQEFYGYSDSDQNILNFYFLFLHELELREMEDKFKEKRYPTRVVEWKDLFPDDCRKVFVRTWDPKKEGPEATDTN